MSQVLGSPRYFSGCSGSLVDSLYLYFSPKELIPSLRLKIDNSNESLQKKIRNAQLKKIPYMLVVGEREEKAGTANVRLRNGEQLGELKLEKIAERIKEKIESKSLEL